jgi:hypothetical protein
MQPSRVTATGSNRDIGSDRIKREYLACSIYFGKYKRWKIEG